MKKALAILFVSVLVFSSIPCGHVAMASSTPHPTVNIAIIIEYDDNLFMNDYALRISVDNYDLGTQEQGTTEVYTLALTEEAHEITFSEIGNADNETTELISISEGENPYFLLKARTNEIEIEKQDTMTLSEAEDFVDDTFSTNTDFIDIAESLETLGESAISIGSNVLEDAVDGVSGFLDVLNSSNSSNSALVDGMRPEFKEAMDNYEKFFDEYINLTESDETGLDYLADYSTFMAQYAETMEDMENWETEDMNEAESAYYFEVLMRINQMLTNSIE